MVKATVPAPSADLPVCHQTLRPQRQAAAATEHKELPSPPTVFLPVSLSPLGVQVVMLGSGADEFEGAMREAERQHPSHFRGWVCFPSVPFSVNA